jgi:DNA-binding response OmpR family regulator
MTRVLVVDDDPTVAEVVVAYLEREGITARHVADGALAVDEVDAFGPDLVVLDLMLPGLDGLEVCRRLRATRPTLPVVMLTARGEEEDRILGLEVGADDYVTKPFSARELVLRVQSLLRRAGATGVSSGAEVLAAATHVDGDLVVDTRAHRATLGDVELVLTAREFDLLAHLVAHPDQALSREDLMSRVWGWEYGDQSTVTVHVRRLREKIEPDPSNPRRLVTVWGVGYRWDSVAAGAAL